MTTTGQRHLSHDRRALLGWLAFALAATAAVVVIMYMGRFLTFWQDEWSFIRARLPWSLDSFLLPHNEHWVLGIAVVWKTLLSTIGMQEYWPYLLALAAAHVATAAAIYWYFARTVNVLAALAASVCLLFLGTAGEDLFWAFQIGFVGATAAGAWAVVLFLGPERRYRSPIVALLLVAAVATSGPGLFFLAAIAAIVVLSPGRRRQGWVLLPATAAYAVWFLAYGRGGMRVDYLTVLRQFEQVVGFVRVGVETAIGNLVGAGPEIGFIVGIFLVGALIWNLVSGGPIVEGAVAGTVGLLSQFLITGISRAPLFGEASAGPSRYGYTAAVFVLIALGAWLGARRRSDRTSVAFVVAIAGLMMLSLAANVPAIKGWRDWFWSRAHETRAAISILERYGGTPAIPADRFRATASDPTLGSLPGPNGLRWLVEDVRLQLSDFTDVSPPVPSDIYDYVLFMLVRDAMPIAAEPRLPETGDAFRVSSVADLLMTRSGECLSLVSDGPDPRLAFSAPGGVVLHAAMPKGSTGQLFLSLGGVFTEASSTRIESSGPQVTTIGLPDLGPETTWRVRFDPPGIGVTRLCLTTGNAGVAAQ